MSQASETAPTRRGILLAAASFFALQAALAYTFAPGGTGELRFWGGNAFLFLPGWLAAALWGATVLGVLLVAVPARAGRAPFGRGSGNTQPPSGPEGRLPRFAGWIFVLAAGALFWLLRSRYALLGDNWLRVAQARAGQASPYESGIMALYNLVGRLFSNMPGSTPRTAFTAVSLASGVLYAAVAWQVAREICGRRGGMLLAAAGLLASGSMELFCGYVEVYPLILALLLLLTWLSLRAARGALPPFVPVLLAALLVWLHRVALLWIPVAVAPFAFRNAGWTARGARNGLLLLLSAGCLGAAILGRRLSVLLPLFPQDGRPYAVFTAAHLSDYLNAQFLGGGAVLVLAVTLLVRGLRRPAGPAASWIALLAWLPPALGLFFFRPLLGAADWDLLALASPFAFLFAAATIFGEKSADQAEDRPATGSRAGASQTSLTLAVLLSAWVALPWLWLQRSEASTSWISGLISNDRADYFRDHPAPLHLAALFESNGLFDLQRDELLRGTREYPADPRFPYNLAVWAMNRKQWEEVERWGVAAYRVRRDYLPALDILYQSYKARGKLADQYLAGRVLLEADSTMPQIGARYFARARLEEIRREVSALPPVNPDTLEPAAR